MKVKAVVPEALESPIEDMDVAVAVDTGAADQAEENDWGGDEGDNAYDEDYGED